MDADVPFNFPQKKLHIYPAVEDGEKKILVNSLISKCRKDESPLSSKYLG